MVKAVDLTSAVKQLPSQQCWFVSATASPVVSSTARRGQSVVQCAARQTAAQSIISQSHSHHDLCIKSACSDIILAQHINSVASGF
jgi:hypothetical protein